MSPCKRKSGYDGSTNSRRAWKGRADCEGAFDWKNLRNAVRGEKVLSFMIREVPSKEEVEKLKLELEKERKEKAELQEKLACCRAKLRTQ